MIPGETILSGGETSNHVVWQVMHTGAGYYVGTVFTHCGVKSCTICGKEDMPKGFQEPNSRETGYFKTEKEAQRAFDEYCSSGEMFNIRR